MCGVISCMVCRAPSELQYSAVWRELGVASYRELVRAWVAASGDIIPTWFCKLNMCLRQQHMCGIVCRLHTLTAETIMAAGVVGFRPVESVANVLAALHSTTHNGFPIAFTPEGAELGGIVRHGGGSHGNLTSLAQLSGMLPGRSPTPDSTSTPLLPVPTPTALHTSAQLLAAVGVAGPVQGPQSLLEPGAAAAVSAAYTIPLQYLRVASSWLHVPLTTIWVASIHCYDAWLQRFVVLLHVHALFRCNCCCWHGNEC